VRHLLKNLVYGAAKWLGPMRLARRRTAGGLRIRCYHGFSLGDEHTWRPTTFMTADTFRQRMQYVVSHGFPVLGLEEAMARLGRRDLPPGAVVITFDDAFYSTYRLAWPVLRELQLPATVYVTTYYCLKENPVFRLAVQYMFWKAAGDRVDLTGMPPGTADTVSLRDAKETHRAAWAIIEWAETQCTEDERCDVARQLGGRLRVDYERLVRDRTLSLMNTGELRELAEAGADLQLHTHRHRMPDEESGLAREIQDNRAVLEPLTGRPAVHFCYPSGVWSEHHQPYLATQGIATATTCDPGLNYPDTPRLALRRFLDGQHIDLITFEAELHGLAEVLRRARASLAGKAP